jgi:hypothetical protein
MTRSLRWPFIRFWLIAIAMDLCAWAIGLHVFWIVVSR